MIEEHARVVAVDGGHVLVEASAAGGCSACAARSGCVTSRLGTLLGRGPRLWRLPNDQGLQAGDSVILSLPEEALLAATMAAYLPPLVGLLAGALLGASLSAGDAWPLIGSVSGFLLGLATARRFGRRRAARYALQVRTHVIPQPVVPIRFT